MQQTRFILTGGYVSRASDGEEKFYRELVVPHGKEVRVLVCAFAREAEAWPSILASEQEQFDRHTPELSVQVILASTLDFKIQIESTDVLIFRGGDTEKLLKSLEGTGEWYNYLDQKTIVGSSAGAYALAKKYVKLGRNPEIRSGLGLIDALVVAHYGSASFPRESAFNNIGAYWEEVDRLIERSRFGKVIRLSEGEYVVLESSQP